MIALVRWVLPAALCVAGVVFLIVGGDNNGGVGVMLLGIALIVWIFDGMARLAVSSGRDREREAAARDEFSRTGHWPDEADQER